MYKFPYNTCEPRRENSLIIQPVSFGLNMITALFLGVMALHSLTLKAPLIAITILSYSLFEFFHAYSHMRHIDGNIQMTVVHILTYLMALTSLLVIIHAYGLIPWRLFIITFVIMLDLYLVTTRHDTLTMFITGISVLASVFATHIDLLPTEVCRIFVTVLLPGALILIALFVNESRNCEVMMSWAKLPYHAIIELVGLVLFIELARAIQKI